MKTFIKMVVNKNDRKKYISLNDMMAYIQELVEETAKNKSDGYTVLNRIATELNNIKKSKH